MQIDQLFCHIESKIVDSIVKSAKLQSLDWAIVDRV